MKTKIILQKDIPNLGVAGDIMDVAPGYARNYLLPRQFAVPASTKNLATWDEKKQKTAKDNQEKLAAAREQAKKIEEVTVTLNVRAGEDGKLFGSITTGDLSRVLAEKGFALDRRWIELREIIRTVGDFQGFVRLHPQVRASFKIKVAPLGG